ncbi:MAG: His/Gly/Thr/Pro-type tRNA ligase C-terminal domain-containing protein, partial [Flavobacterium sp.]|nr:His/Gly/Thr/Pro-type tRNA ligase C-terminal domain-containing protein [Flavobacterium sp.]
GEFPLWLTPEQCIILPISERFNDYAKKVLESFNYYDIRGLIDLRDEKIGRKIRDAEVKKIPFMVIIGEKEQESATLSIRKHGEGDLGSMTVEQFAEFIKEQSKIN